MGEMNDDSEIFDTRKEAIADALEACKGDEVGTTVTSCAGPPRCFLQGEEAIQNQIDGCPTCSRDVKQAGGTWKSEPRKAN